MMHFNTSEAGQLVVQHGLTGKPLPCKRWPSHAILNQGFNAERLLQRWQRKITASSVQEPGLLLLEAGQKAATRK